MKREKGKAKIYLEKYQLPAKYRIIIAIIYTLLLIAYIYFASPLFNINFLKSITLITVIIIIYLLILSLKTLYKLRYFWGLIILVILLGEFISAPIFHSEKYRTLLGDVKEYNYEEVMPEIDNDLIPVVDEELAQKLGDKVIGDNLGLGSQYEIGDYYLISTKDDLVWVAPLEPRNFFKWVQNNQGSPGYVYVSATNPNEIKLVQNIEGQDLNIKYTNQSFLNSEVYRHTYLNGNFTKPMTDFSFELDDSGKPYWVISVYEPTILFKGYDSDGVIVVDAQTGESNYYKGEEEIPSWIERVIPEWIINDQIEDWGLYVNGWLNSKITQKEVIKPTEGHSYVYIEGEPYYYTGLTSIKNDESTVGFMLVNLRTKESQFYKINGATEIAAKESAEGAVQQYGYKASFPILLNTNNVPTYFMTLKDDNGLLKQYAYVSVSNYNIVGVGDSIEEAEANYFKSLSAGGILETAEVEKASTEGEIQRIQITEEITYFKLKGDPTFYQIDTELNPEIRLSQTGDKVKIEVPVAEAENKEATNFGNLNF